MMFMEQELSADLIGLESLFDDELLNVPQVKEELYDVLEDPFQQLQKEDFENENEPKKDILGKLMTDLELFEQPEELKTAGIGITEDPFFTETSKAANLFAEPIKKEEEMTQDLIEEMEQFLNQHETIVEDDIKELEDSGFVENNAEINSLTELYTDDGQRIVIVIANEDGTLPEQRMESPESPEHEGFSPRGTEDEDSIMDSSDSEWSPSDQEVLRKSRRSNAGKNNKYQQSVKSGKVTKKRGPYHKEKRIFSEVKDKKERKKLQNVVAARRYRDKKKNEMFTAESTEDQLKAKNDKLKSKMSELEGEVKTLKKLVFELGLVKKSTTRAFLKA